MATKTFILNENYAGKKADGTFPIIMRVAHKGDTKFYKTGFKVLSQNWDAEKERVIGKLSNRAEINDKIEAMAGEFSTYKKKCEVNNLPFNIEKVFRHEMTDGNFTKFFKLRIKKYEEDGKLGYRNMGQSILNHLAQWNKGKDLYYSDLDLKNCEAFLAYLKKQGNAPSTINVRRDYLRCIYNKAIKYGGASEPNPFASLEPVKETKKKKDWLTKEEIERLSSARLSRKAQQRARDMFLFSYYCKGMRFQNVFLLEKGHINKKEGMIHWISVKSNLPISMRIHPKVQEIISRWENKTRGKFLFFDDIKDGTAVTKYNAIRNKNILVNLALQNTLKKAGITKEITFHNARHTFANHFKRIAKNLSSVQEALGHGDITTTQIYTSNFHDDELDKELLPMYE